MSYFLIPSLPSFKKPTTLEHVECCSSPVYTSRSLISFTANNILLSHHIILNYVIICTPLFLFVCNSMFLFLLLTQPIFFSYYVNTVSNIFQHKLLEISRNDEKNFQSSKCWHTHQRKLLSTLWVQSYSVSGIISSFKNEEIYVFCSVG